MAQVISYGIPNAADAAAERILGETLLAHYPFVMWFVDAQGEQGIVDITCPELHAEGGQEYGFRLKLEKLKGWDDLKKTAIMAGGELLERANVNRSTGQRMSEKVDKST